VAVLRLVLGDILEGHAVKLASRLEKRSSDSSDSSDPDKDSSDSAKDAAKDSRAALCQLYFDAYAVAVWTSAHAEYLYNLKRTSETIPSPSIFSVPCMSTQLDFTTIYERKTTQKMLPKEATSIIQLLSRCTNPGTRGWEPVIDTACKCSVGKRVLIKETEICLTGLHSNLHPAHRPHWKTRFEILHATGNLIHEPSYVIELKKSGAFLKEAMKRCVGTMWSTLPASYQAHSSFLHPCCHLSQPPLQFSHIGLEHSMIAFARAGVRISKGGSLSTALVSEFAAIELLESAKGPWISGWLGKGTPHLPFRIPLSSFAEAVFLSAFKANFMALWMHAYSNGTRLVRIDEVQHKTLIQLSASIKICNTVPELEQLRIQRLVLFEPTAGLMSVSQALLLIGYPKITLRNLNQKHLVQTLGEIKDQLGSLAIGKLLCFARVAWVKESILIFGFADSVKTRNAKMLLRRLTPSEDGVDGGEDEGKDGEDGGEEEDGGDKCVKRAERVLLKHHTCICICTECQRVASACVDTGAGAFESKLSTFNEIGIRQSMVKYAEINDEENIYCAKRSSAAFRTGALFQSEMQERCIECVDFDRHITTTILNEFGDAVGGSLASKLRRDSKSAIEQRSCSEACGTKPLLKIDLMGRAVRMYGSLYTFCRVCACIVKFQPAVHRFHGGVCCLRCDDLLHGLKPPADMKVKMVQKPQCRYCGAIDPERTGIRWKIVKAPHDIAGENSTLPPPLRRISFCPTHFRPWIVLAARVLETRVILAHISTGARPVVGDLSKELERMKEESKRGKKRKKRM
jgi:hypothetical protein